MSRLRDKAWYTLFVLPLVFIFTTVVIIPFIIGIGYSFVSWDGMPLNKRIFVGFDNYVELFKDARFLTSAGHTLFFTICTVFLINILGLTFALIVQED
jgi:raffinose/stachyose/melibiose transport system permease protein